MGLTPVFKFQQSDPLGRGRALWGGGGRGMSLGVD